MEEEGRHDEMPSLVEFQRRRHETTNQEEEEEEEEAPMTKSPSFAVCVARHRFVHSRENVERN